MTSSDFTDLLASFRSDIPEPDMATAVRIGARIAALKSRPVGWLRPRVALIALAAVLALTGAAIAAVKEIPWWQDGAPPVDPQSVALVARDNLPAHVDVARARTVVEDGTAALVAVPLDATGYCLIPTLDRRAAADIRCDYQVKNVEQGDDDQASSFARPARGGASAAWIVYGRITDPRAKQVDLGPMRVTLANGGFFLANVPSDQWSTLGGTANQGQILDSTGRTLRRGCVNWGPQPAKQGVRPIAVPLWREGDGPCKPQTAPALITQPTLDLTHAKRLSTLTLTSDVSIWHAGDEVAIWQARAIDQWGVVCTYVAAASPHPTGTSVGAPGQGECSYPTAAPPEVQNKVFVRVSFGTGSGGLITGTVGANRDVARVVLRSAAGETQLALGDNQFFGQLPAGGSVGQLPPGGPFTLIAYDASGKELGEASLDKIYRDATPK